MLSRLLHDTAQQIQALTRTASAYGRANNAEMTELYTLTGRSNEDLSMSSPSPSKVSDMNETGSLSSDKPRSVQQYKQRWSGWRVGMLNFATCASIVFFINLVVTIWGSVTYSATEGVLDEGNCRDIKELNSGLHVLINVLSTILLSGSNYCMQCLSAPTRSEINRAHGRRRWLDIGIPSYRNLRYISRRRLILWLMLAGSSLPLHLLYNSAIYASLAVNSYDGYVVSQAFVDDPTCQNCTNAIPDMEPKNLLLTGLWAMIQNGSLDKLEPAACINAYGTSTQSLRRNLLVVTANENVSPVLIDSHYTQGQSIANHNLLTAWNSDARESLRHYYSESSAALDWICSGLPGTQRPQPCINRLDELKSSSKPWTVGLGCYSTVEGYCDRLQWPVDYCLSEKAEPLCRLHFSLVIAIVVTVLNFFKALLMFYIVYTLKDNPLMTIGDAVASFLDERDVTSRYLGLFSISEVKKGYSVGATAWNSPRQRWKDATSKLRRLVTLVVLAIAIFTVLGLLIWALTSINSTGKTGTHDALRLGFGEVDPRTLISSNGMPTDIMALALIANLPQVILSLLYYAYNSLFTAMLMGYEWTSYAHKRKGLRMSRKPTGYQRSTYFLQLPYRFSVPLVILSGMLHWLVSQSIFVVAFDLYDEYGKPITNGIGWDTDLVTQTAGYSPIAMLTVVILGIMMVAAVVGFGFVPYKAGMPLAGSCSLAMSAACHPEERAGADEGVLSEQKLQWGVVSTSADGIAHCAFSSNEVAPLRKGQMYA